MYYMRARRNLQKLYEMRKKHKHTKEVERWGGNRKRADYDMGGVVRPLAIVS